MNKNYKGQSLTEILIALAIGVAFINVGILAMSTANILAKVNKANNFALSLLKSQRSVIETITESGWHSIADLIIGKHYKLAKQNNSWIIQQGEEKVFDEKPPVAQWNFDEGSGTMAYDNVGTDNGTLVSSLTWQTNSNCVSGSCLGFNGSNNYVNIKNTSQLQLIGNLAIEFWINPTNLAAGRQNILDKAYGGEFSFTQEPGGGISYYYGTAGGMANPYQGFGVSPVVQGQWQHFVLVRDFTNSKLSWYRNGVLVSSTPTTYTSASASAYDVNIGLGYTGVYYNGSIDDVRIYDYALSDAQIKQHYNAGLNRLGLVSQWGMDEGSGIKAYDSQGTHDGTLTSGPTWKLGTDCVNGGCLSFDGVDDIVTAGTGNNYFPLPLLSVCAWIKTPGLASGMSVNGIFSLTYGLTMYLNGSGQFIARLDDGTSLPTVTTTGNLYDNKFHNVCMTYDGSYLHAFVDGVWKNKLALTTWSGTSRWPTNSCNIGCENNNCPIYRFNGSIDDVRIYNRALSTDEIKSIYDAGLRRNIYISPNGLISP